MKNNKFLIFFLLVATLIPLHSAGTGIEKNLFVLTSSCANPNPLLPWEKLPVQKNSGYALRITEEYALTTESLIHNSTLTTISPPSAWNQFSAKTVCSDKDINLALIRTTFPPQNFFFPFQHENGTVISSKFETIFIDESNSIKKEPVRLQKTVVEVLPNRNYPLLLHLFQSDSLSFTEGQPILNGNGQLFGIVVYAEPQTKNAYVIPAKTISLFTEDSFSPPYLGKPTIGITWTPLNDPVKRSFLGVAGDNKGIHVLDTLFRSGKKNSLLPDDIIIKINGTEIDSMGYYNHHVFGKILFSHIIEGHKPEDSISLTIIRNHKETTTNITLWPVTRNDFLIPPDLPSKPEYIIAGGCLLIELTLPYMTAIFREQHADTMNSSLLNEMFFNKDKPKNPGDRIVILSTVFPDLINQGYQNLQNVIVTHVNGKEIRNLHDVFAIKEAEKEITAIRLKGYDVGICFDPDEISEANKRIMNKYNIPILYYNSENK